MPGADEAAGAACGEAVGAGCAAGVWGGVVGAPQAGAADVAGCCAPHPGAGACQPGAGALADLRGDAFTGSGATLSPRMIAA